MSPGSNRVLGTGSPNIPAPQLQIWSAGPNGIPEPPTTMAGGSAAGLIVSDDELLGLGGTNGAGSFFDGQLGIGLVRALRAGDRVYAVDTSGDFTLVGPIVPVGLPVAPAPLLSWKGLLLISILLAMIGIGTLSRPATQRSRR